MHFPIVMKSLWVSELILKVVYIGSYIPLLVRCVLTAANRLLPRRWDGPYLISAGAGDLAYTLGSKMQRYIIAGYQASNQVFPNFQDQNWKPCVGHSFYFLNGWGRLREVPCESMKFCNMKSRIAWGTSGHWVDVSFKYT